MSVSDLSNSKSEKASQDFAHLGAMAQRAALLSRSENVLDRRRAARYKQCPRSVLITLFHDEDSIVAGDAATHANFPFWWIAKQLEKGDLSAVWNKDFWQRKDLPEDLLESAGIAARKQGGHRDKYDQYGEEPVECLLYYWVCRHENTPDWFLARYADYIPDLLKLVDRPKLSERAIKAIYAALPRYEFVVNTTTVYTHIASRLTERDNLPAEVMNGLARHANQHVRKLLASTPNLPKEAVDKLVRDWRANVRAEVASKASLTPLQACILRNDRSPSVIKALLSRKDAYGSSSKKVLEIAVKHSSPTVRATAIQKGGTGGSLDDPSSTVRKALARKLTDEESLKRLAADSNWAVRTYAAANKNAPESVKVVAALMEDAFF